MDKRSFSLDARLSVIFILLPSPPLSSPYFYVHFLEVYRREAEGNVPLALFPETNPLIEELKALDIHNLTPIEALNRLYEWKRRFVGEEEAGG